MNSIIVAITGIACVLDLFFLMMKIIGGSGSDFSYYVCRPFGVSCFSLVVGFVLRMLEVVIVVLSVLYFF